MYEYVCMRDVSGGAKWASAESRVKKKKKGGGKQKKRKEEKSCAHDTSQPHYTMEGRTRACSPAALTMIRLPRSRTPSPSSGSHQDSHDLMMREGGGGRFDYSYAADESAGHAAVSHTDTHAGRQDERKIRKQKVNGRVSGRKVGGQADKIYLYIKK